MITLEAVSNENKALLYIFFQHMMYEMSYYYDDDMDENGIFTYGNFDSYFESENKYKYFIKKDDKIIGFVMLNKESFLKEDVDYNLAFFTIFPAYREKNNGRLATVELFKKYQGKWEIKYNKRNIKAKNFWKKVTKDYNVKEIEYDSYSNVLSFSN